MSLSAIRDQARHLLTHNWTERRSLAIEPGYEPSPPFSPDDITQEPAQLSGGLTRSQTVVRREGVRRGDNLSSEPSPVLSPDWGQLPIPSEQPELPRQEFLIEGNVSMSQFQSNTPPKISSDSGQSTPVDRWTQRRLQRLNTEQGFREQRQGGQTVYSPPGSSSEQSGYSSAGIVYPVQEPQTQLYTQQAQPNPSQQPAYQIERTVPANANAPSATQAQPVSSTARSNNYQRQGDSPLYVVPNLQYSPTDSSLHNVSQEGFRPSIPQPRSYSQQQAVAEDTSMSSSNNGNLPAPKASRSGGSNRQSTHNGASSREGSTLGGGPQTSGQPGGVPAFNASVVPPAGQGQAYPSNPSQTDVGRKTPQPLQTSEEMTEEDINQLIKELKELRMSCTIVMLKH